MNYKVLLRLQKFITDYPRNENIYKHAFIGNWNTSTNAVGFSNVFDVMSNCVVRKLAKFRSLNKRANKLFI